MQKIKVLVVDDFADTRDNISKLLFFEKDIEVVGTAADGRQAIEVAKDLHPHIILMDINMPVMDGIAATEAISSLMPESQVIMMSVQGEADYLRRAMLAGAREYLVKPFACDELADSIRHVHELGADKRALLASMTALPAPVPPAQDALQPPTGQVISVFSAKGGVGRTTVATNLAVSLRTLLDNKKVALVDCSLLFGDVGILMNLTSGKSISDLVPSIHNMDIDLVESVMVQHESGVRVLLAPPRPELSELVTAEHLRAVFSLLQANYDYVIVDTFASFEDTMLAVLDCSHRILVVTTLEMPAIKNLKIFLEVTEALQYPHDKLCLVLNRSDSTGGIRVEDIEQNIRVKVSANLVSAGQAMTAAVNQGTPVVLSHRDSTIARNFTDLAKLVMSEPDLEQLSGRAAESSANHRDSRSGRGFGKLRLPSFAGAGRKGDV